jgi:hypothetical protein
MLEKAAKTVILILCPFLGYGLGISVYEAISNSDMTPGSIYFGTGFFAFAFVWFIFRRRFTFLCTLEHEITHLVFGLLFLKLPRGFRVTLREGGHVKLKGSNFLIYLAPYFFPTVSYLLVIPILFVSEHYRPLLYTFLGASVAFHLAATWADLRPGQSDLRKSGLIFSLFFLPTANLAAYGTLLALAFGGVNTAAEFWRSAILHSIAFTRLFAGFH